MKDKTQFPEKVQRRIYKTTKIISDLESQGYTSKEKTIGLVFANVVSILICVPLIMIFGFIYYKKYGFTMFDLTDMERYLVLGVILISIVIHELIHGLFMGIHAGWNWKDVEFGVSSLTPYCTCQVLQNKTQYIISLLMPTVILGFLPGILSIVLESPFLFVMSASMIFGGGGDFLITCLVLRCKDKDAIILDHPYKCGYYELKKN